MHDQDLDAVLQAAFPQGYPLLRCEHGVELLRHGARNLIESPMLARSVLGARTTRALGLALRALGNRYLACADSLLTLADQPDPTIRKADKPHSGAISGGGNTEAPATDLDSLSHAHAREDSP